MENYRSRSAVLSIRAATRAVPKGQASRLGRGARDRFDERTGSDPRARRGGARCLGAGVVHEAPGEKARARLLANPLKTRPSGANPAPIELLSKPAARRGALPPEKERKRRFVKPAEDEAMSLEGNAAKAEKRSASGPIGHRYQDLEEKRRAKGILREWALSVARGTAQHVLLTLIDFAGVTGRLIAGQDAIAAKMGKSPRTVWTWLKRLESTDPPLIHRTPRFLSNGHPTSDLIELVCPQLRERQPRAPAKSTDGQSDESQKTARPLAENGATARRNCERSDQEIRSGNRSDTDRACARGEFFQNSNQESETKSPCTHARCAGLPRCRYGNDEADGAARQPFDVVFELSRRLSI